MAGVDIELQSEPPAGETIDEAIDLAAALCRRFEGLRLRPYLCPAGVPTVGYGATHYLDGRRVRLSDMPVTPTQADRLLLLALRRTYLPAVLRQCPHVAEPRRLAALVDWTFNLGEGNLRASTLRRKVNAEAWDEVPAQLMRWTRGGGRVLPGLVARRRAEAAMI